MNIKTNSYKTILLLMIVLYLSLSSSVFSKSGDWILINDKAIKTYQAENFEESISLLKKALIELKRDTTANPEDYSTVSLNIAASYRALGDYSNARENYLNALLGYQKSIGNNNADYATAANNYSLFLSEQGLYEESNKYAKESLSIRLGLDDGINTDIVNSLETLASLRLSMGDYETALRYSKRAIASYKKLPKQEQNNISLGESEARLGFVYRGTGDYENALIHTQIALKIFVKQLPAIHTSTANALNEMGLIYNEYGKYNKAKPYFTKALSIYKSVHGEGHAHYAYILGNIADNLTSMGEYGNAEKYHLDSYHKLVDLFGENHSSAALRLNNYAHMKMTQGEYEVAYIAILEAIKVNKSTLGYDHPDTTNALEICKSIVQHLESSVTCADEGSKQARLTDDSSFVQN